MHQFEWRKQYETGGGTQDWHKGRHDAPDAPLVEMREALAHPSLGSKQYLRYEKTRDHEKISTPTNPPRNPGT
jgi:hypothetical protein